MNMEHAILIAVLNIILQVLARVYGLRKSIVGFQRLFRMSRLQPIIVYNKKIFDKEWLKPVISDPKGGLYARIHVDRENISIKISELSTTIKHVLKRPVYIFYVAYSASWLFFIGGVSKVVGDLSSITFLATIGPQIITVTTTAVTFGLGWSGMLVWLGVVIFGIAIPLYSLHIKCSRDYMVVNNVGSELIRNRTFRAMELSRFCQSCEHRKSLQGESA